jgi:hypothetical protein
MQRNFAFRAIFLILVLGVFIFQTHFSPAAGKISFQEILSNPDKYNGQEVTVQGKASKIKLRTSKGGNDYTTLKLTDDSGKILNVFSWGHPALGEGQKVTVTGSYQKVKRVGKKTFYNVIEARNIIR